MKDILVFARNNRIKQALVILFYKIAEIGEKIIINFVMLVCLFVLSVSYTKLVTRRSQGEALLPAGLPCTPKCEDVQTGQGDSLYQGSSQDVMRI